MFIRSSRRQFMSSLASTAAFFTVPGLFAQELARTPSMTEGPFYPDRLPLDTDNDLIIVGNSTTPAIGQVTHLTGRVLDAGGSPIRDAVVEIWQCDGNAVYHHTGDAGGAGRQRDTNFQGFGRFTTGATGEYRFRTIKPVPYPGRPAPHIHVKIKRGDRELLTTQLFMRDFAGNQQDGIFRSVRGLDRQLVLADFRPVPNSRINEVAATWDIVLGRTPADADARPR